MAQVTQQYVESNPPTMKKKKRNLPGTPDPEAKVIALSPKTLMATNRYVCEVCGKGFQRDQNLQLHRRGHNLPWKLKQRITKEPMKRVYVCPEKSCVHHNPMRALGDLTGIKKHFCRKHGEKKWKCDKCCKRYAVRSDWKAHSKICGTREHTCGCGTIFSRRDSFVTHRAFCDALAEETARVHAAANYNNCNNYNTSMNINCTYNPFLGTNLPPCSSTMVPFQFSSFFEPPQLETVGRQIYQHYSSIVSGVNPPPMSNPYPTNTPFVPSMSATGLLQKAAFIGSTTSTAADMDATELCGFYGPEGVTINSSVEVLSDVEDSANDTCTNMNFYQYSQVYPFTKRQKTSLLNEDSAVCGRNLDFLGVGVPSICHPSSVNGLF